jgi:protein SCO1/2
MKRQWIWLLLAVCTIAVAQPLTPAPKPPDAGLQQRLNVQLPLRLPLVDSTGRIMQLGDAFRDRPVLLVLGYYRCPQLCGLLMHGLLEALHESRLPRNEYEIVRVSIDPDDTPQRAALRRDLDLAYADFIEGARAAPAPLQLTAFTGTADTLHQLADAVGIRMQRLPLSPHDPDARFAHPATVIVATPDGHISRYLDGVRFDPWELRLALVQAGDGRIGEITDKVALLCAHIDARFGRYNGVVLAGVRALGIALVLLLGGWAWRHRTGPRDER